MTAPCPKQPPCNCRLRTFPHREDQYCRELREPNCLTSYERGVEERAEDRDRARAINLENGRRR